MTRTLAIAVRILRQIVRDPRTIVLILVAPVLVTILLHEVVAAGEVKPRIAVVGSEGLAAAVAKRADLVKAVNPGEAARLLDSGEVDATVSLDEGEGLLDSPPEIAVDASDPATSAAALKALRDATAEYAQASMPALAKRLAKVATAETRYLHGSPSTTVFDFLAPVVLGFLVFFFTFILAGIAFLRERTSGTLERAFAAPVRRRDIVLGYMIGFGAVAAVQTALLQLFIVGIYRAPNACGFLPTLFVDLALAFSALAMGLFLSAYADSEFQMLQFIPLVIVPQVLFAGIFNLRSGPPWMTIVSDFFPLTYAGRALRDLMIRGRSLASVFPELAALCAFGAVFIALAIKGLGRNRGTP
jgi:ABC-2 type transport system permease protein